MNKKYCKGCLKQEFCGGICFISKDAPPQPEEGSKLDKLFKAADDKFNKKWDSTFNRIQNNLKKY